VINSIKSSAEVEEGTKCKLARVNSTCKFNVRENFQIQKCRFNGVKLPVSILEWRIDGENVENLVSPHFLAKLKHTYNKINSRFRS